MSVCIADLGSAEFRVPSSLGPSSIVVFMACEISSAELFAVSLKSVVLAAMVRSPDLKIFVTCAR